MVTSRERDYMYQMYAADPRARLNLGIRRRLAPLMENDPERIKLMNSLLLSMPGSPIIYYGDEIGMGDNLYLGDRNGVRTPMQWSPDRNAGFSRADPQQLYLPPIMDPIYGYEAVNVEAQQRDRSSLLNWMKRILQVRKTSQAFGRGTLRFIRPGNRKVLVYLREFGEDSILCVANLSRSAQPVELDLSSYKGAVPIELLGRTPFPPIGELPYFLTLPSYGFYWFKLSRDVQPPVWHEEHLPREDLPVLVLIDGWKSFFAERVAAWRAGAAAKLRAHLEERVLPQFIAAQRWFAAKGTTIKRARLTEHGEWQTPLGQWLLGIFDVESEAVVAQYFLPLSIVFEGAEESRWFKMQAAAIARVRQQAIVGVLAEATADESFCRAVVDAIGSSSECALEHGVVHFSATRAYAELRGDATELTTSAPRTQGSNTTLKVGERLFLKFYRKLQPGLNPELEIGRYLTEVAHFPAIVPVAGAVEYRSEDGTTFTLALLQAFVPNQGDGWDYTVNISCAFWKIAALPDLCRKMHTAPISRSSAPLPRAPQNCTAHWRPRPPILHSRPNRSGRGICQLGNSRLSPRSTRRSSCWPYRCRHCRKISVPTPTPCLASATCCCNASSAARAQARAGSRHAITVTITSDRCCCEGMIS